MTELFRDELNESGKRRLSEVLHDADGDLTLGYQNAASLVRHRVGDKAVARAIRRGVLAARNDLSPGERENLAADPKKCLELLSGGEWNIPAGYRKLAAIYAALPSAQRGPVVTTNFDPLLTLAFRDAGLSAESIPVPLDAPPSGEQLAASISIPVLHVHGYWTTDSTLHGISQLTRERPTLQGTLREIMRESVVLVIGYGGWPDAFMSSLAGRVKEASMLGAEILWAAYSPHIPEVAHLKELVGVSGFSFYTGVDGHHLSLEVPAVLQEPAPFGFARVAAPSAYSSSDARAFADGMQPGWDDARAWPVLSTAAALTEKVCSAVVDESSARLIVASGPVGEGKSQALRQAAVAIDENETQWKAIWKEPGGARLNGTWFERLHRDFGKVVVFVDEADLIIDDIKFAQEELAHNSDVVLVLAMHDRIWQNHRPGIRVKCEEVLFSGLTVEDAGKIAAAWGQFEIEAEAAGDPGSVQDRLVRSAAGGGVGSTLFGAVLDVRYGEGLKDRVRDLVAKLLAVPVADSSGLSIGQVFLGICLLQDTRGKPDEPGASRNLIAAMADLPGVLSDGRILGALGREAAISFAGQRVVARHPVIAQIAVGQARDDGILPDIARLVGRAGGRLRASVGAAASDFRGAYLLGQRLPDESAAVAAATGALEGASRLLEARVTLMSVLRRFDAERSLNYAAEVARHLDEFEDVRSGVRAFFNEFSVASRQFAQPMRAIGFASLALADDVGFALDEERAQYALGSLFNAALDLRRQAPTEASGIPEATYRLASSLSAGPVLVQRHFDRRKAELGAVPDDTRGALRVIETECAKAVEGVVQDLAVLGLPRRLALRDLERLVALERPTSRRR
ncbi:SIR2 family protein [Pimelobacter simplex]|uniref:P-loop NTPase n=1 Tax=Nocardioides simplex TaxID=2045 RepID=UPI003AAF2011